ncbi:hypothetical protein [Haladaptatus sp. DYF46]|uniref:hypothetical protein n=1 Tax=Haladaptatus sp. DYF46 TaxID=2886041 RepID=UPI001E4E709B|nr:hypothetical protein [Haladaptatus sp. DYF46]
MTRQTRRTFLATADAVGFAGCSSVADKTSFPADEASVRRERAGGPTFPSPTISGRSTSGRPFQGRGRSRNRPTTRITVRIRSVHPDESP